VFIDAGGLQGVMEMDSSPGQLTIT